MRDPSKYRTIEVNRNLWRVFKGDTVVGHVRKGLDNLWYPEVGTGVRTRIAAVQSVILANEAVAEFVEASDGHG